MNGSQIKHGFTAAAAGFKILAQAAIASQPGEGAFNNPPPGLDLETLLSGERPRNLNANATDVVQGSFPFARKA